MRLSLQRTFVRTDCVGGITGSLADLSMDKVVKSMLL